MRPGPPVITFTLALILSACGGGSNESGTTQPITSATTTTTPGAPLTTSTSTTTTTTPPPVATSNQGPADPSSLTVVATIPVDLDGPKVDGPDDIAYGAGSLWVAVLADRDAEPASQVVRIDPATGAVIGRFGVGRPGTMTFAGGAVWVSNFTEDTVTRIDAATEATVVVDFSGDFVGAGDAVWGYGRTGLHRIDASTGENVAKAQDLPVELVAAALDVTPPQDAGPTPPELFLEKFSVGGGRLWVADEDLIASFDAMSGELLTVTGFDEDIDRLDAMAAVEGGVWVLVELDDDEESEMLFLVSPDGMMELKTDLGAESNYRFLTADDNYAYPLDEEGLLSVVSSESGQIITSVRLDTTYVHDIVTADGFVWVTQPDESLIAKLG